MKTSTYKKMLVESLVDISSMSSYKTPADKVLNATDEKFETFRSATSEVDVLGRAYAGQDDWDNKFITEGADMDEENLAQGEPEVKVTLPDGHEPDVSDLEDNIDESDPDKNYQEPITGEQDMPEKLNENAEDPHQVDSGEEDQEEEEEQEGTITEPSDDMPDEHDNVADEIKTEDTDEFGEDLPEDEPIEDDEFQDDGVTAEEDEDEEDEFGEDLPEDEPITEDPAVEEAPVEETPAVEAAAAGSEEITPDVEGGAAEEVPAEEQLPEDEPILDADDPAAEEAAAAEGGEEEVCPECGQTPCACEAEGDTSLEREDGHDVPAEEVVESLQEDATMDPNADLGNGGPAPVAPAVAPEAPVAAPVEAAPAVAAEPNSDPNAQPAEVEAGAEPADPNAVADDANTATEQDPILDVDSNVVASDTTEPTTESVMESLITELGSYVDHGTTDIKALLDQEVDD